MGFDFVVGDTLVLDGCLDGFEEEGFGEAALDFDEALSNGELVEGWSIAKVERVEFMRQGSPRVN